MSIRHRFPIGALTAPEKRSDGILTYSESWILCG